MTEIPRLLTGSRITLAILGARKIQKIQSQLSNTIPKVSVSQRLSIRETYLGAFLSQKVSA